MTSAQRIDHTADNEIVLWRVFEAPRELVWKAWTDNKHLGAWWGPQGFRTTTQQMSVQPGGQWRFIMHGPDGRDYQNLITYVEVKEPELLRYTQGGDPNGEPVNFTVTVTFEKQGDAGRQTKLTMRLVFPSKNAKDFVVREYNALEGGKQHLGRLAEYLAGMQASGGGVPSASKPFSISRVLKAPPELVWKVWTQRDHLHQWFGPKGIPITACTLDLRGGGVFHYCMQPPQGPAFWGKWVFREVVENQRLEFLASFSDETGAITRHPMAPVWPLHMLTRVTLAPHAGIGKGTLLTVESSAYQATPEEQKAFDDGHASMTMGWGGTMELLEAYLAGVSS